jgi:hypothetical protein
LSKLRINHAPDFFRIMRMRKSGASFPAISQALGIHKNQVRLILNDTEIQQQARRSLWAELSKGGK